MPYSVPWLSANCMWLHRTLIMRSYSQKITCIAAGIADTLLRQLAGKRDQIKSRKIVVVCWWIAYKFELIYPPDIFDIVDDFALPFNVKTLKRAEARVLTDVGFLIPRHNTTRDVFEGLGESTAETESWIYALLHSGLLPTRSAQEWVKVLQATRDGTTAETVIQCVCAGTPRRMRNDTMKKIMSVPRITYKKRKREEIDEALSDAVP